MNEENAKQQGFSLLVVLLTVLAIAAILTPLALGAKTRAIHAASLLRSDQLDFLADGTATILASLYAAGPDDGTVAGMGKNSTLYRCTTGGLTIDYALQRQNGLIDLNLAPEALLSVGFQSLGYGAETAQEIAGYVVAFRSSEDGESIGSGRNISGGLKKAPMETISELYDIRPIRNIPLQRLGRVFTVYSRSDRINLTDAPHELRSRLSGAGNLASAAQQSVSDIAGPTSVSVSISDGKNSGRFNGIFDVGRAVGKKPVILASWRYDIPDEPGRIVDEGSCQTRFGSSFESTIAAMR